jgi:hypothetical protein
MPPRPSPGLAATTFALAAAMGCAIGAEQEPGCHTDADCGGGWTCRAGACFATSTGFSDPDAGDAGDAGPDGG